MSKAFDSRYARFLIPWACFALPRKTLVWNTKIRDLRRRLRLDRLDSIEELELELDDRRFNDFANAAVNVRTED